MVLRSESVLGMSIILRLNSTLGSSFFLSQHKTAFFVARLPPQCHRPCCDVAKSLHREPNGRAASFQNYELKKLIFFVTQSQIFCCTNRGQSKIVCLCQVFSHVKSFPGCLISLLNIFVPRAIPPHHGTHLPRAPGSSKPDSCSGV